MLSKKRLRHALNKLHFRGWSFSDQLAFTTIRYAVDFQKFRLLRSCDFYSNGEPQ